jgi:hypothetical protein
MKNCYQPENKKFPGELSNNDKTLIRDLLSNASGDLAHDLAHTLLINQGTDSLSKNLF